ncbi:MAG: response regulator [Anaerolineaceae bacterium]|jgi:DNA-binding NarL/FixJ family response regulator|nr:response regulator [Anaerolineaceae bacterium]
MPNTNILLADDHAIVRAGIRKTIEEMPGIHCVCEVGNGPQVLAALKEHDIDCLLIDVTMPDFEPITAIRHIRKLYPQLKILVVSAYDDDVYVQGLLGAGVNGYHMKDQPLNDLKLAVARVLAGERWITSSLIDKLIEKPEKNAALPNLTNRQRTLLQCLQQGLDNQSIAQETGLSIKTIENHMTRLYRQLGVQSRLEAANFVMRHPQILGSPEQNTKFTQALTANSSQSEMSILVVDDNARYRKQLQRMISKLCPKAKIFEAEDIPSAVEIARQVNLKLALVDVVLGDVNGINCVQRIKTYRPETRIILISAYPDREFHRQGLESGAVAFLDKKDLGLSTLRQVIDDVPE